MKVTLKDFSPTRPLGFVVLEGVNGAGKSTLLNGINQWMVDKDISTCCSFEPGGTPLGQGLRKMLLEESSTNRTPLSEAFLFSADRAQHVETVIRPALEQRTIVLLDRYYYSTIAFQGYGHGLSIKPLLKVSEIATSGLKPDLVILLDLEPEEGLRRNHAKTEEDRFEKEEIEFHKRLRNGFLKLSDSLSEPFVVLDATAPQEDLLSQSLGFIEKIVTPLTKS